MSSGDRDREKTIVVRASPLSQIRRAQGAPPSEPPAQPTQQPIAASAPAEGFDPAVDEASPPPLAAQPRQELTHDFEADTALPPISVRNPLSWLASRILVRLAGMRTGTMPVSTPEFHAEMSEAVTEFRDAIQEIGYDRQTVDSATYILAATVDDVMQNIPSTQGFEWARRSMVVTVFGENIGGDRFWQTVDELLRMPSGKHELLELVHACVAAGFLGKYRISGRQDRSLQDRMAAMHAELARTIQKSGEPLSPHWRGVVAPTRRIGMTTPLLAAAALCGCILLGAYAFFLFALGGRTDAVSEDLTKLHSPLPPLVIERSTPPPKIQPPPITSTRLTRVRDALASEIADGSIAVEAIGPRIRITTRIGGLFKSGSDQLDPAHLSYIAAIAKALNIEKCRITIIGHTDADRLSSTLKFPNNQALSEARARSAALELQKGLDDRDRIDTEGLGSTRPIAPGSDAESKALNRRIEIFVPLDEGE